MTDNCIFVETQKSRLGITVGMILYKKFLTHNPNKL